MAKPVSFELNNVTYNQNDEDDYGKLPAYRDRTPVGNIVTCWELDEDEIETLLKTKRIYLHQLSFNGPMYPTMIVTECPVKALPPELGTAN